MTEQLPKVHKYLYHCKNCGWHHECATKDEYKDVKKSHQMRGCDFGFIPLANGTKLKVRDDIASEWRELVEEEMAKQRRRAMLSIPPREEEKE